MSKDRKYWKLHAKESLRGKWGLAIGGMIIVSAVNLAGNYLASGLFPGQSVPALVMSQVFIFVVSLIGLIFTTGYSYLLLNISRGKPYGLINLLYLFRKQPDRVLVAGLVVSLIDTIVMIPFNFWTIMTNPADTTLDAQMTWIKISLVLLALGIALGVVIKLPLALTFYLLADNPEMGGLESLQTSIRMMHGNKWKYFLLQLSFLPLLLLSVITLYIAFLWLLPYMQAVDAAFYMDVCGEFDEDRDKDNGDTLLHIRASDDYNAEA